MGRTDIQDHLPASLREQAMPDSENYTVVEPDPTKSGSAVEVADIEAVDRHPIGTALHDGTNISSIFWAIKVILAQGQFQLNFFFADPVIVRSDSQVSVSISEASGSNVPFLGNANMGVLNVVPQSDGTITVRGHVDHPSRLRCVLNFIIVN
jgi:hypothetical protein